MVLSMSCRSAGPAAPPAKLPRPPSTTGVVADAALVWIVPEQPESVATEPPGKTGLWQEPARARTFWVSPAGSAWVVAAERPGLFLAVGDRMVEARFTRFYHTEAALPPKADAESDNLAVCRDLVENGGTAAFEARGHGLTLRDVEDGGELDVVTAPDSVAELDWVADHQKRVELQGGLGEFLFLRVLGWEAPCGGRGDELNDFVVYDLGKRAAVTAELVAAASSEGDGVEGRWLKYIDLPHRRRELAPGLKSQLREYDESTEYDPENLYFSHLMPVFPKSLSTVALQTTYRYWAGCRACPQFVGHALVEDLPPELAAWQQRHLSLDQVAARLPAGWRLAGITLLSAKPDRAARLRAHFEAAR